MGSQAGSLLKFGGVMYFDLGEGGSEEFQFGGEGVNWLLF